MEAWNALKLREDATKAAHAEAMKKIRQEEQDILDSWRDAKAGRQQRLFNETPPPTDEVREAALDAAAEENQEPALRPRRR